MAEPFRKRARFFGNIEIEHRKLDRPFKKIAADEDPAGCLATSRCQLRRAFAKQYEEVEAVVDLELIKGGTFKWHTASFSKLFQVVCRESPSYKRLVLQAFLNRPPSTDCPWDLIVYADEVTPENILKVDNQRKMLAFYAAVKQMGPLVLKGDTCWLPLGILRTNKVKETQGGVSAAFVALLGRMFLAEKLCDRDGGVVADIGAAGGVARFYFRLSNVLADGDALRALFGSKGAFGKLPCICCKNVVRGDCAASTYLQPLSCSEPVVFELATDDEVLFKADMLAAASSTAPIGQFEELQTALGMTHNAHGLLAARQLRPHVRPISVMTYDSMHILVSGGLAQNEVGLLMGDLDSHGIGWQQVKNFITEDIEWRWCGGHGISMGGMRALFSEKKRQASQKSSFKCQASEMLLLLPILSYFLWSISAALAEELRRKTDSLAKLCEVVGL